MQVKMKTITSWQGKLRRPGNVVSVDEKTAQRWQRNGIAEILPEVITVDLSPGSTPADTSLDNLTMDELREFARDKGIAPGNLRKADLIKVITQEEEE